MYVSESEIAPYIIITSLFSPQQEEARPSMTIDSRQTENNMREKAVKVFLHFTQKPQTPQNKQPDVATAGMNTNPHTRDPRRS